MKLRSSLYKINGRNLPSVLVGTKADLSLQRKVRCEEGKKFASKNDMPFLEISIKNDPYEKLGQE